MQNSTRSAEHIESQRRHNVLRDVTLTALRNNIHLRYGYLHHTVEEAFEKWLEAEGYQAFLEWLKER